jgi:hypothetical protein
MNIYTDFSSVECVEKSPLIDDERLMFDPSE